MAIPIWKEILAQEGAKDKLNYKRDYNKKFPEHKYYCSRCRELIIRKKKHTKPRSIVCKNCNKRNIKKNE